MESRNYDSDGRDGRRRRSDSPPSPRPQRDLPPHLARRDAHLEEGRKGSMVKGDDGVTRWQRRASPDYDRGRDGDRRDPPPERPAEGYARSNGYPRDNGYPERRQDYAGGDGRQGGYRQQGPGYAPGGRNDFFEHRRQERWSSKVTIWPSSPPHAYGEDSDGEGDRKKKHKSHRSDKKSSSKHHKSSKRYYSDESDSDLEDRRRKKKSKSSKHKSDKDKDRHKHRSSRHRSPSRSRTPLSDASDAPRKADNDDALWVERAPAAQPVAEAGALARRASPDHHRGAHVPSANAAAVASTLNDDADAFSDDGEVGPMPYNPATGKAMDPKEFGKALRPGEGSAMAAYVESGQRIPRRGEIGLQSEQIEKYEKAGFVMSGSRHRRMNAVRIRKENQVISAEEKRGILKMQAEEKAKREGQIVSSFRELVDTKLSQAQGPSRG